MARTRSESGGEAEQEGEQRLDHHVHVVDHAAEEREELIRALSGEQAAVELGRRLAGDDVGLRAPDEDGRGDRVVDEGVLAGVAHEIGRERRIASDARRSENRVRSGSGSSAARAAKWSSTGSHEADGGS